MEGIEEVGSGKKSFGDMRQLRDEVESENWGWDKDVYGSLDGLLAVENLLFVKSFGLLNEIHCCFIYYFV